MLSLLTALSMSVFSAPLSATIGDIHLYVDPVSGNDSNSCLAPNRACKTPQEAMNRVPKIIRHEVTITIAAGDIYAPAAYAQQFGTKGYAWGDADLYVSGLFFDSSQVPFITHDTIAPSLTITCAQTQLLGTTTPTAHAVGTAPGQSAGGPNESVTVAGASWTVNQFQGFFIKFNADGQSFPIISNSATQIFFVGAYLTDHTGSFTIWRPATRFHPIINPASTDADITSAISVRGVSGTAAFDDVQSTNIVIQYCEAANPTGIVYGSFSVQDAYNVKFENVYASPDIGNGILVLGNASVEVRGASFHAKSGVGISARRNSYVRDFSSLFVSDYSTANEQAFYIDNDASVELGGEYVAFPRIAFVTANSRLIGGPMIALGNAGSPEIGMYAFERSDLNLGGVVFTNYPTVYHLESASIGVYQMSSTTTGAGVTNIANVDGTNYTRAALEALNPKAVLSPFATSMGAK